MDGWIVGEEEGGIGDGIVGGCMCDAGFCIVFWRVLIDVMV